MLHFVHVRKRIATFIPAEGATLDGDSDIYTKTYSVALRGGVTVAYLFHDVGKKIDFSVAFCSKKDNYCKKIGRELAASRTISGSVPYDYLPDGKPTYKNISAYFNTLFKEA